MTRATRLRARGLGGLLLVGLVVTLIPSTLCGGEVAQPSAGTAATHPEFVLTVHEGLLSLRAQDASPKGIFEAIGRQLSLDVVTRIPADERITLAFEQLSLTEALQRLRPYVNLLVVVDGKAPDTVRKLIVVSKRLAGEPARPTTHAGDASAPAEPQQSDVSTPAAPLRPKPFHFEFDPTALGQRGQ